MLLSSISLALTRLGQRLGRWSPLALWPDGVDTPGMWISPRDLTSQWADYTGTTPVSVPGTVADSSNPVGLALDIRAGATVLTDPGNHMLQSTSAARPLLSARVNLLTYTEDFSNAAWSKAAVTVNSDVSVAPDGTTTADSLIEDSTLAGHYVYSMQIAVTSGIVVTISVRAKNASGTRWFQISMGGAVMGGAVGKFDPVNGAAVSVPGTSSGVAAITDIGNGWYLCQFTFIPTSSGNTNVFLGMGDSSGSSFLSPYQGDGSSGFYIWGAQYEQGPTATAYQRVNTASDYDASAGPTYLKFDGVDDSMATAAFAAGTLTSGMDCMIAVRRYSAGACVAGLYNGVADATKFFGMAESGSGSGCVGSGAGTPTVWVDGTQLAGGTAVTRGTLHTALTVGDVHILEFRGLDLSTWTSSGFGLYTGYLLNGPRGDILLYPSTASTTDKDAARQWLADYYGVTLP